MQFFEEAWLVWLAYLFQNIASRKIQQFNSAKGCRQGSSLELKVCSLGLGFRKACIFGIFFHVVKDINSNLKTGEGKGTDD